MNKKSTKRTPDLSQPVTTNTRAVIEVTNDRYQEDLFWAGPKGLAYGLLLGHQDWQVANAYPDANSTYFVGQFKLPSNARIELKGHYGHVRYFSFTISNNLGDGVQGGGTFLRDEDIVPDRDSVNPFVSTNPRNVGDHQRRYTVTILPGLPPETGAPANTLYTGTDDPDALSHLALRSYLVPVPELRSGAEGRAPTAALLRPKPVLSGGHAAAGA